jgi:DHA1 family multidrug resistance protein-like MFS transporter
MKQRLLETLNLSLVSGFVIMGLSIISPVLPQYALSFSAPVSVTGWAISAFALARTFTDIPAGLLADRFGKKGNMISGLLLIVISSVGAGLARDFEWLIVARVLEGLGSAFYITSATAWIAQISAGKSRGSYMAVYSGLIFAGTAFGPTIGGFSAVHFGLNSPFFVYAGLAVIGMALTVQLHEPGARQQAQRQQMHLSDLSHVLRNGSFLLVNVSVFALFFLRGGVRSTLIPLFASLNLGLSEEKIGIALTVAAVATTLVTFPSGWLSDRVGRKIPIIGCLLLSAAAVLIVPSQSGLGGLTGVMALYGLATGLQGSIAAWPADVAPPEKLGTYMGVYRVIGDLGLVLGPITVSYIAGSESSTAIGFTPFLVPALIAVLAGLLMLFAKDPVRERGRREDLSGMAT